MWVVGVSGIFRRFTPADIYDVYSAEQGLCVSGVWVLPLVSDVVGSLMPS